VVCRYFVFDRCSAGCAPFIVDGGGISDDPDRISNEKPRCSSGKLYARHHPS